VSASVLGRLSWEVDRDKEGHRNYTLRSLVETTDADDGPVKVIFATGLPAIGSFWAFGNDVDVWAFCTPELKVTPVVEGEPNRHWEVEQKWTTKPLNRCQDQSVENPLMEPQKVSGSFVQYSRQVETDRHDKLIKSSSHEIIRGVEKDDARPSVSIGQNVLNLQLPLITSMRQTVNDSPLWGLPARCIKLSRISWSRVLYGLCFFYYTRTFEFDIKFETWDLDDLADVGFKKYGGDGDRADPANFIVIKDKQDENSPERCLLDGNGDMLVDPTNPVFIPTVELYEQSNFLSLGIPTYL